MPKSGSRCWKSKKGPLRREKWARRSILLPFEEGGQRTFRELRGILVTEEQVREKKRGGRTSAIPPSGKVKEAG